MIVKLQALRRFVYRSTRYLDALRSVEKVEKCKIKHKIKIKQIFHIPNIAVSAPLAQQPVMVVRWWWWLLVKLVKGGETCNQNIVMRGIFSYFNTSRGIVAARAEYLSGEYNGCEDM